MSWDSSDVRHDWRYEPFKRNPLDGTCPVQRGGSVRGSVEEGLGIAEDELGF